MIGLYIHIPFCIRKCAYCDFCSFPADSETMRRYTEALTEELRLAAPLWADQPVDTVFIGGGTPTLLAPEQLARVLGAVATHFSLTAEAEYTVEANPATVTAGHLEVFKAHGVNRISLGLQATQDALLRRLGRSHSYEQFLETYRMVRGGGAWAVNLDLIYHLPGQTRRHWQETLERVVALAPEHISCYSLQLEEGTPLEAAVAEGRYSLTSDRNNRWMHHYAIDYLKASGYDQYEISNFSKPGCESRHNLRYWKRSPYLGLGLAAHSFDGQRRLENPSELAAYHRAIEEERLPGTVVETLSREEALFEEVMLGLRLTQGIDRAAFLAGCPEALRQKYEDAFRTLGDQGLLKDGPDRLILTRRGMDLSNRVFATLMDL